MTSGWHWQGVKTISGALLLFGCGAASAAGNLAPLKVDPALLGLPQSVQTPPAPQPAAEARPLPQPAAPQTERAAVAPPAAVSAPPPQPVPQPQRGAELQEKPPEVAPAQITTRPSADPATPAVTTTPRPPPASPALPTARSSTPIVAGAQNLPLLRVDPALLGVRPAVAPAPTVLAGAPAQASLAPAPGAIPQPATPSRQSAPPAGAVPARTTTPFSTTDKHSAPTHVSANTIVGVNELELVAEGGVVFERAGDTLSADRIVYQQIEDEVEATGNVRMASPDSEFSGPRMRMRLEESTGEFETPAFRIRHKPKQVPEPALTLLGLPAISEAGQVLASTGRMLDRPEVIASGTARRIEFRGEDKYRLEDASYSTCSPSQRDWEIRADRLDLDYLVERGNGSGASIRFKDTPIFYLPWMSFSLNDDRKSGFLSPTYGSTSKSGIEIAAPWYWNIAPHIDATITPRLMTKRGLQLNAEFRYLLNSPNNRNLSAALQPLTDLSQIRFEYLPDDKLARRNRYAFSILHNQLLAPNLTGTLNLNGISDDNYFSDLSTRVAQVSQGNQLRQGTLSYGGPWYNAVLNLQSYQTQQSLVKPYQRLPQISVSAFRYDLPRGLAFNLSGEYVNFDHPSFLLGKRSTLYPQLSLPLASAAFTLTPKIGLHVTHYSLDRLTAPGTTDLPPTASASRTLPIFSIDGGLTLERDTKLFGNALVQTLEPRAYYVFAPHRDQRNIPIFDTGLASFNYAQMFTENRYAGGDRVGDANELTLAVTSRLIDPASGADRLRATLGTRYYFRDQTVVLPGEAPRSGRSADILATLAGQVLPHTYADFGWQYNPRDNRTDRLTLGGRYRPETGKVLNTAYRFARDGLGKTLLEQIDVSAQWPLSGGWHGVGRYNYSLNERRLIETVGGLEYNAGCWVGRIVLQRLATIAEQPTSSIFFQLELNDLTRIGSNPLQILRRSIPGYGIINQPTADPVFAEN